MKNQLVSDIDRAVPFREALSLIGKRATAGHALVKEGKIRTFTDGRRRFVRASEVRRFLDTLENGGAK